MDRSGQFLAQLLDLALHFGGAFRHRILSSFGRWRIPPFPVPQVPRINPKLFGYFDCRLPSQCSTTERLNCSSYRLASRRFGLPWSWSMFVFLKPTDRCPLFWGKGSDQGGFFVFSCSCSGFAIHYSRSTNFPLRVRVRARARA